MKIGDRVEVAVPWEFNYSTIRKEGVIQKIYPSGWCEVKIPLEYGGYRIVKGYLKNCKLISKGEQK